ncbi:Uncharacterized protein HZ326_3755 [Fusarium oxysporum f. sp. albedinis]|nr:Uncharacterized protein HZ326_3755 [Fusarium oxysporum f. sp. albedinis]
MTSNKARKRVNYSEDRIDGTEETAHPWCDYELDMSSKQPLHPSCGLSPCGIPSQRLHTRTLLLTLVAEHWPMRTRDLIRGSR